MNRVSPTYIFAALACLFAFSAKIADPLTDTFHEGELVGFLWHMRAYYGGEVSFPLLVHGGMDYLPSLVAAALFGNDAVIIGTRFMIAAVSALVFFLSLDLSYSVVRKDANPHFWLLICIGLFYYFVPPMGSDILSVGSFPLRELFLILTVWCFTRALLSENRRIVWGMLLAGSLSTAVAFFWCYDRGIIAVVFLLLCALGLAVRREAGKCLAVLGTVGLGLVVLGKVGIFGTLAENLNNIRYWLTNARDVNPLYPLILPHLPGYFSLLLLVVAFLVVALIVIKRFLQRQNLNDGFMIITVALLAVQMLLIKVAYGRADIERSFFGGWPTLLIFLNILSHVWTVRGLEFSPRILEVQGGNGWPTTRLVNFSLSAILVFLLLASPNALHYPMMVKALLTKRADTEMVPTAAVEAGQRLAGPEISCYFNWTNDGTLALLSGKSFCTDYAYVHYSSTRDEARMLEQLRRSPPQTILLNSNVPGVNVGGKYMAERFPLVHQYIKENYQHSWQVGEYLVVSR
jgi:hypothetical protein